MSLRDIHRRTAAIVLAYSAGVTALMVYFALSGYAPLVFYTPVIWIALPLMAYAWLKRRRERGDDLW